MTNLSEAYDDLNFAVEKSVRYHQRRHAHYARLQKLIAFGIIVSGSAAFVQFSRHPEWFGLVAAILGALDFVIGFSLRAREHAVLQKRFADLAGEIRSTATPSEEQIRQWKRRRMDIETEEPPLHYALEAWCDNEVSRAWGWDRGSGLTPLSWWQRLMMNWLTYSRTQFPDRISLRQDELGQRPEEPKKNRSPVPVT
jgi:hypothetical protein